MVGVAAMGALMGAFALIALALTALTGDGCVSGLVAGSLVGSGLDGDGGVGAVAVMREVRASMGSS